MFGYPLTAVQRPTSHEVVKTSPIDQFVCPLRPTSRTSGRSAGPTQFLERLLEGRTACHRFRIVFGKRKKHTFAPPAFFLPAPAPLVPLRFSFLLEVTRLQIVVSRSQVGQVSCHNGRSAFIPALARRAKRLDELSDASGAAPQHVTAAAEKVP